MSRTGAVESPKEARRSLRQRTLLRARLAYLDGSVTIDAVVTQISETGAKINLAEDVNLPERFRIEIPQRRLQRRARLVRREAASVAVAFEIDGEATATDPAALLEKLAALETENRALRAALLDLNAQAERNKASY